MQLPITIGIPTYRREESLRWTLRQIEQLAPSAAEVIVVDQTPEHASATEELLRDLEQRGVIRWLRQENPSLCRARNRILAEARNEWVLFLDDDVLFKSSLLRHYWTEIERNPVGAWVGQVYQVPRFESSMLEDGAVNRMPLEKYPHYNRRNLDSVDFLRGCNFVVHRETAIQVGGFDEALFGSVYGDEMDFALRLLLAGKKMQFLAKPWLVHLSAPAGGCRIMGNTHFPEWQKTYCSWLLLFRHNGYKRSDENLYGGRAWPFLRAIFRSGPLRRENVVRPQRWFQAWWGVCVGAWRGWLAARAGVQSPFKTAKP